MKRILFMLLMLFFATQIFARTAQQDLPRIAVYVTGEISDSDKRALGSIMLSSLVNSGRYRGVERNDAFLDQVMQEHETQRSGMIDDNQISALGRQFGVKYVCIADIAQAFGAFQLSARIVDVETAEVVHIGEAFLSNLTASEVREVSNDVIETMFSEQAQQAQQARIQRQQQATREAQAELLRRPQLNPDITYGEFIDLRDNRKYFTVTMPDGRTWMAENMNHRSPVWTHNEAHPTRQIRRGDKGSWCYNNSDANCQAFGRLYTFGAAQEVCPSGWRLPTATEWNTLVNSVRRQDVNNAGLALRAANGWRTRRRMAGTNTHGFSALPGSFRNTKGEFGNIGETGVWWTSTDNAFGSANTRTMSFNNATVMPTTLDKRGAASVRCILDDIERVRDGVAAPPHIRYSLTVGRQPETGGAVRITPARRDLIYNEGARVTLTATPSAGYVFAGFAGNDGSILDTNRRMVVTMRGNTNIVANFRPVAETTFAPPPALFDNVDVVQTETVAASTVESDASYMIEQTAIQDGDVSAVESSMARQREMLDRPAPEPTAQKSGGGFIERTTFGARVAYNLSNSNFDVYRYSDQTSAASESGGGVEFGAATNTEISDHLNFISGVSLIFRTPVNRGSYDLGESALAFPALVRYNLGVGGGSYLLLLFAETGSQFDFAISDIYKRNAFDVGYVLGFGVGFGSFEIGNRFIWGMRDFADISEQRGNKLFQYSLGLTYMFGGKE